MKQLSWFSKDRINKNKLLYTLKLGKDSKYYSADELCLGYLMIFSLGLTSRRELVTHSEYNLVKGALNFFFKLIKGKKYFQRVYPHPLKKFFEAVKKNCKIQRKTAQKLPTVSPQKIQVDYKQNAST